MMIREVRVRRWLRHYKKQLLIGVPSVIFGLFIIVQVLYPSDRLVPWLQIDGQAVGVELKQNAAKRLNEKYKQHTLSLYFGDAKKPQYTPKLNEFGLTADNTQRINDVSYPWYLRLVPTSIIWMHNVTDVAEPAYERNTTQLTMYLQKQLGGSCQVAPINATAKVVRDLVEVIKEEAGGTCQESDVKKNLLLVKPMLSDETLVRITMKPIAAKLTSDKVKSVVHMLNTRLAKPVIISYDDKSELIEADIIRSWLTFASTDASFDIGFDSTKADKYLNDKFAKALERPAGISKVTTHDFVEVSRVNGQVGRRLDTSKTLANLKDFLLARTNSIPAGEAAVSPQVQYTRSYSNTDTGLSALIKNYAETHPGTYGVSMIELDGKRRRAAFNDTQKFTTASTYKLYVAFSALKRVESGEFKWTDQIAGGRTLERCFDDMIVKSDNACAEAFVAKIGYRPLTTEANSIVSTNTTFLDSQSYKTTAADLSTFMASLATGQIPLHGDNQARFLGALKRNVYRQGIPAGAGGTVADKVGFLDGFLHDAAIIYGSKGTYALSIMTDKSSWANIAELTREIEKLRSQ